MVGFEHLAIAAGALTAPRGDRARLTVLLYHRVLPKPDPLLPCEVDAAGFDAQLACISRVFHVLPLAEAIEMLRAGCLPARAVAITFDDGYRDNLEVAAPILNRHRLHATFFIATGFIDGGRMMHDTVTEAVRRMPDQEIDLAWIGLGRRRIDSVVERLALVDEFVRKVKYMPFDERRVSCDRLAESATSTLPTDLMMNSDQVRKLKACGMGIGAHTHDHPILTRISPEESLQQIVRSKDALTSMLGVAPGLFAYPNGKPDVDYHRLHVEQVMQAGFSAAVSVSMGTACRSSDHYQIPRFIPWDRDPRRLVTRMLAQPLRHPGSPVACK